MAWPRTVTLLLLLLASAALPAVVLPRPPSSPNFIPSLAKDQSTNVEKPDTQDYRFVEIELRDAENVDSLDLHGLVEAVLGSEPRYQASPQPSQRRLDLAAEEDELEEEERRAPLNLTYPQPEVVPRSILGVRDVGLGPSQRLFEPSSPQAHYLLGPPKNLGDEKLYYLKSSRPKVYVNFRGRSGNFRQQPQQPQQPQDGLDSRVTVRLEPAAFLRQPYPADKKGKPSKRPPKKYDPSLHGARAGAAPSEFSRAAGSRASSATTTENTMVTSSELPKQIPAPPSRIPSRSPIVHTTPVQRFTARRSDILPGYAFAEP